MLEVHDRPEGQIAALSRKRTRRRYDAEFKRELVEQALSPEVSVAGLALEHGINANLLRTWVTKYQQEQRARNALPPSPVIASPFARVVPANVPVVTVG